MANDANDASEEEKSNKDMDNDKWINGDWEESMKQIKVKEVVTNDDVRRVEDTDDDEDENFCGFSGKVKETTGEEDLFDSSPCSL